MKLNDMQLILNSRVNVVCFLKRGEINTLNQLFCGNYLTNGESFKNICTKAIDLYKSKSIMNIEANQIFEILEKANTFQKKATVNYENTKIQKHHRFCNKQA